MPKVSVYLPDALYQAARDHDLSISALTQQAIVEAVRARTTTAWVSRMRARQGAGVKPIDTSQLIDEVREDFGL